MKSSSTNQAKTDIQNAALEAVKLIAQSAAENVRILANAASDATRLIANATSEAAKVVANTAAATAKVVDTKNTGDHDTLITLVGAVANIDQKFTEKFAELRTDIADLRSGTSAQIDNHEGRLTSLEVSKTRQNVLMSIGIAILTLLVSLLVYHLVGN